MHWPQLARFRDVASCLCQVQYVNAEGQARAGYRDFGLVLSAFVALAALRAAVQLLLYASVFWRRDLPLKSIIRFTEQGWCFVYYGSAAFCGWKLLRDQPYGWNAKTLWVGFPHMYVDPRVKAYYLWVFGYWLSQIFVIHIEDKRSDHYQMFTHHIVTCALVWGSYSYGYTRIGHLVMIMMDFVDTWLSIAKCSKYLRINKKVTDFFFMVFIITWIGFRHGVYMYEMLYGMFYATPSLEGECALAATGEPLMCFSRTAHTSFFILAMILQIITLVWLWMIIKVVIRVLRGQGAVDSRSDDER